jgi:hypothetical protein
LEAEPMSFIDQPFAQVNVPRPRAIVRHAATEHDLRTNFITLPTNSNTAMHYDLLRSRPDFAAELSHPARQDPGGGAAPAGVQQCNRAMAG